MSGNPSTSTSGGSAGAGFSGGGQTDGTGCGFVFETVLASPDPLQVEALAVDDSLVLDLQENPPAVVANRATGETVGGITQYAADLRACMQRGFTYKAKVLSINGGAIKVHVEPASA